MARYRIAVCDDEPSELEDIVESVKRYDVHVEALRKNEQEKLRAEFNEQQYRLQMEYYQQLKERQEETRALWHDIKKYILAMEKRGSRYLRYALYTATKYVCYWNPVFTEYLTKKQAEGKHYNVALSHATKKLVRLIYALQKSGKAYLAVT